MLLPSDEAAKACISPSAQLHSKEFNTAHKSLTALNLGHHAATTVTVTALAPLLCHTVYRAGSVDPAMDLSQRRFGGPSRATGNMEIRPKYDSPCCLFLSVFIVPSVNPVEDPLYCRIGRLESYLILIT